MRVKLQGRILSAQEAMVPLIDHGFLFGDSVYETMRTIGGRLFRLEDHLSRLRRSAAGLRIAVPWSDEQLRADLEELRSHLEGSDHYLRLIVSRGPGEVSYRLDPEQQPALYILGGPFEPVSEAQLRRGFTAEVVSVRRNSSQSLPPSLKTGNLLNARLAHMEAEDKQADEAIMLNLEGYLSEASTSNLFLVMPGGALVTPSLESGLLEGVTRTVILELARKMDLEVREELIPASALETAEEAFLSSTTRSFGPLRRIGSRSLEPVPGPLTQRLMKAFLDYAGAL